MNALTPDTAAAVQLGMRQALAGLPPHVGARLRAALGDPHTAPDLKAQHTAAAMAGIERATGVSGDHPAGVRRRSAAHPGWKAITALYEARPAFTLHAVRAAVAEHGYGAVPEIVASSLRESGHSWFRMTNSIATGTATVRILDEVGEWGVTAQDFIRELAELDAPAIDVHLNSPGGEVFAGITIMNALRSHPAHVTVYVEGLAASIASVIAMAGDRIVMRPHSQMMIHDGSGICVGTAAEMRASADLMDRQSDNIAAVYAERAGGTIEQWRTRMQAETWYTAQEAVAAGLADEVA